jgi:hypothetical protein
MNQRRKRIPQSGEVVLLDFPGVKQTKRRPAVIVSSSLYYQQRTDVVVGLITAKLSVFHSGGSEMFIDRSHNAGTAPFGGAEPN